MLAQSNDFFTPNELRQINKIIISARFCDTARIVLTKKVNILDKQVFTLKQKSVIQLNDIKLIEEYNYKLNLELTNLQTENKKLNNKIKVLKVGFVVVAVVGVVSVGYLLLKK